MKKYTFLAIIDGNAVVTDGNGFYTDGILKSDNVQAGMFSESNEGTEPITDAHILHTANKIAQANARLTDFSVISFDSRKNTAVVEAISTGNPETESVVGRRFLIEDADLDSISDGLFDI